MFTNTYLVCSMEPQWYDYENEHAIRNDEHDYEEEDYYYDDNLEEGEYDEREDLGWDGQLED